MRRLLKLLIYFNIDSFGSDVQDEHSAKHDTLNRIFTVGPSSTTLAQQQTSTGSVYPGSNFALGLPV